MCRPHGCLLYRSPIRLDWPIPPPQSDSVKPVPLKAVSVEVKILDLGAEVTIRQRFVNVETQPIEAVYQYPLAEDAAVTGFEAEIDGHKLSGMIKEKEAARDTYSDAIASGGGAYLVEHSDERPDVLSISVGNLPPKKEATISITYVTDLSFNDEGLLQFVLPSSRPSDPKISPYYREAGLQFPIPSPEIRISIEASSNIRSVTSPSHPIGFEFGEAPNQGVVTLSKAQPDLSADFILLIKLSQPSTTVARLHESTTSPPQRLISLSLHPDLEAAGGEPQYTEIIFIIDRSGSMSGSRITSVRNTMQLFLRSLEIGTLFNIIGFGNRIEKLFPTSVEYNERTLATAAVHISGMRADLGGTNILSPLRDVFSAAPREGYPRQVFLLTDGEVENTEQCVRAVRDHADTTRVFTFGIGGEASQELVRGLARAGNGAYEFIQSGEPMDDKVLRQLARAMRPALTRLAIDWPIAVREHVRPAPFAVPPLFSGGTQTFYAFVDTAKPLAESLNITLRGQLGSRPYTATVAVDTTRPHRTPGDLVHKLAARRLVRDFEDGRSYLNTPGTAPERIKAEAIAVSTRWGVLSQHTAFVAVETRDEATSGTMQARKITPVTVGKLTSHPVPPSVPPVYSAMPFGSFSSPPPPPPGARSGAATAPVSVRPVPAARGAAGGVPMPAMKRMSTAPRADIGLLQNIQASVPLQRAEKHREGPALASDRGSGGGGSGTSTSPGVRELVVKQKATGAWGLADLSGSLPPALTIDKLMAALPAAAAAAAASSPEDVQSLWATAIAVAYLQAAYPEAKVQWDLVVKKARRWMAKEQARLGIADTLNIEAEAANFLKSNGVGRQ